MADRHYDFRYLPGIGNSIELCAAAIRHYEQIAGCKLDVEKVMAWHALTVLGDALWRTEAGVELPGGGNASSYVDSLTLRFSGLGLDCSRTTSAKVSEPRAVTAPLDRSLD